MKKISEMRLKSGMTQNQVANTLKVDRSTVAKWETGDVLPRAATLATLAEMYHCTMEELLEEGPHRNESHRNRQTACEIGPKP